MLQKVIRNAPFFWILLVFTAPMLVGYFWKPSVTINSGTLVGTETSIQDTHWYADGVSTDAAELFAGKWTLLFHATQPCTEECKKQLDALYKMWGSLGLKRQSRVRLYSWGAWGSTPVAVKRAGYNHLSDTAEHHFALMLEQRLGKIPALVFVDPQLRLVLYFEVIEQMAQIRKDLARLLKASRIG